MSPGPRAKGSLSPRARRTRRELIGAGALTAGAALVLPAGRALAHTTTTGATTTPESTGDHLRRMLSVELLLLYCYEQVLGGPLFTGHPQRVLTTLHRHEQAHVRTLTGFAQARGESLPAPPSDNTAADDDLARRGVQGRVGQLQGRGDAMHLLLNLEQVVSGVYFVALLTLEDRGLIQTSLQIMAAEAQHEALLGELLNHGNIQKAVPYGLLQGQQ